jgi:MOSC domain-containing protein YiiM
MAARCRVDEEMDMRLMGIEIAEMYAGSPQPLDERGRLSAIAKSVLAGPWQITPTGLAGDMQADPVNHGGVEKAVHHYPRDHYAAWASELPAAAGLLKAAPAFGENISTVGMTEKNVHVGDVYRLGEVLFQVSQGRQPCWKLNARFGVPDMARRVQSSGRTGWYYRVLTPGEIRPGDSLALVDRPQPDWPLARISELLYHRMLAYDDLAALADVPELAAGWRKLAARRVENRAVESWERRLGEAE